MVPLDTDKDLETALSEVELMQSMKECPNMVTCYGAFPRVGGGEDGAGRELWLVLEYCGAGSVGDVMRAVGRPYDPPAVAAILAGALNCLRFLHGRQLLHRDLKCDNILINNKMEVKVCDFGVSTQLRMEAEARKTVIGTPFWMAPEIFTQDGYGTAVDMWSLGITAIEASELSPPHSHLPVMMAIMMIPSKPPPRLGDFRPKGRGRGRGADVPVRPADAYPAEMHDFIAKCLVKEPADRATAASLVSHPFLVGAYKRRHAVLLDVVEEAVKAYGVHGRASADAASTVERDTGAGGAEREREEGEGGGGGDGGGEAEVDARTSEWTVNAGPGTTRFGTAVLSGTMVIRPDGEEGDPLAAYTGAIPDAPPDLDFAADFE